MIDKSKQYRTRNGREVRIYAVDGGGDQPVHAAIKNPDGWKGIQLQADGTWCEVETPVDLIEVKPRIKREVWVNVYRHDDGSEYACAHFSREEADDDAGDARVCCVKMLIDCEEGEWITDMPPEFMIAQMRPFGIPSAVYFMVVLTIAAALAAWPGAAYVNWRNYGEADRIVLPLPQEGVE